VTSRKPGTENIPNAPTAIARLHCPFAFVCIMYTLFPKGRLAGKRKRRRAEAKTAVLNRRSIHTYCKLTVETCHCRSGVVPSTLTRPSTRPTTFRQIQTLAVDAESPNAHYNVGELVFENTCTGAFVVQRGLGHLFGVRVHLAVMREHLNGREALNAVLLSEFLDRVHVNRCHLVWVKA
jgi:hypothetical protein